MLDNDVIDPLFCPDRITKAVETKSLAPYITRSFLRSCLFGFQKRYTRRKQFEMESAFSKQNIPLATL